MSLFDLIFKKKEQPTNNQKVEIVRKDDIVSGGGVKKAHSAPRSPSLEQNISNGTKILNDIDQIINMKKQQEQQKEMDKQKQQEIVRQNLLKQQELASQKLAERLEKERLVEIQKKKINKKSAIRRLQKHRLLYLQSQLLTNPSVEPEYSLEQKRYNTPLPNDDIELDNIMATYKEYRRIELENKKNNISVVHDSYKNMKKSDNLIDFNEPVNELTNSLESSKVSDEQTKNDCVFCLTEIGEKDRCVLIPCGHTQFHNTCMQDYMKIKKECPVCKTSVKMKNKIYL